MYRIGIPRALHGIQHYPLWRTFFEDLGAQVVLSPSTNRDMVASGARIVADVTCLPVKVYADTSSGYAITAMSILFLCRRFAVSNATRCTVPSLWRCRT